ncbi:hypothetical protein HKCCE3408_15930, partial [Rhodobacterales bacterium HKCCE3408]|nr:hypothetical protein [Rhodobacterales bacterium HKCCE3408]
ALGLQDGPDRATAISGDGAALLDSARAALSGLGAPRDYAAAYLYALLAEAHGVPGAGAVIADVETLGRLSADRDAFAEMLADLGAEAREIWFDGGE